MAGRVTIKNMNFSCMDLFILVITIMLDMLYFGNMLYCAYAILFNVIFTDDTGHIKINQTNKTMISNLYSILCG